MHSATFICMHVALQYSEILEIYKIFNAGML